MQDAPAFKVREDFFRRPLTVSSSLRLSLVLFSVVYSFLTFSWQRCECYINELNKPDRSVNWWEDNSDDNMVERVMDTKNSIFRKQCGLCFTCTKCIQTTNTSTQQQKNNIKNGSKHFEWDNTDEPSAVRNLLYLDNFSVRFMREESIIRI